MRRTPVQREGGGALGMVVSSMGKLAVTEDELKAIKVPVTVIVGDQDPFKRTNRGPAASRCERIGRWSKSRTRAT